MPSPAFSRMRCETQYFKRLLQSIHALGYGDLFSINEFETMYKALIDYENNYNLLSVRDNFLSTHDYFIFQINERIHSAYRKQYSPCTLEDINNIQYEEARQALNAARAYLGYLKTPLYNENNRIEKIKEFQDICDALNYFIEHHPLKILIFPSLEFAMSQPSLEEFESTYRFSLNQLHNYFICQLNLAYAPDLIYNHINGKKDEEILENSYFSKINMRATLPLLSKKEIEQLIDFIQDNDDFFAALCHTEKSHPAFDKLDSEALNTFCNGLNKHLSVSGQTEAFTYAFNKLHDHNLQNKNAHNFFYSSNKTGLQLFKSLIQRPSFYEFNQFILNNRNNPIFSQWKTNKIQAENVEAPSTPSQKRRP